MTERCKVSSHVKTKLLLVTDMENRQDLNNERPWAILISRLPLVINDRASGVARNFKRGEGGILTYFFGVIFFFFGRADGSRLRNRKGSKGVRGHAPLGKFEILHAVMAILVLFEHFEANFVYVF